MDFSGHGGVVRIVRGNPDDVELAALLVVLAAVVSASRPVDEPATPSPWWVSRLPAVG